MKSLGTQPGIPEASLTNRLEKMEERISGIEDTIEEMDTLVKKKVKSKNLLAENRPEIGDTMKKKQI